MKFLPLGLLIFLCYACSPVTPVTTNKTPSKSEIFQITATYRASASASDNNDNVQPENVPAIRYLDRPAPIDVNAQITSTLQALQINPNSGRVGWLQPDLELHNTGLQQIMLHSEYPTFLVDDFIFSTTITKDSTNPVSACGFSIQSRPNELNRNQVLFLLTNLPDGYAYFTALTGKTVVNSREFYFQAPTQLGASPITLFVSDNTFQVFIYFEKIGEFNLNDIPTFDQNLPPTPIPVSDYESTEEKERYQTLQLSYRDIVRQIELRYQTIQENFLRYGSFEARGYVSVASFNETGTTNCVFRNTWVWIPID